MPTPVKRVVPPQRVLRSNSSLNDNETEADVSSQNFTRILKIQ